MRIPISLLLALLTFVFAQKQPHFLGNRTTMVHLFEWPWSAIAQECEDFLGPRGYAGVQLSPPNEARIVAQRPWWERYQPISYQLHSRSGNEAQLRDMIERCNRAGVRIYVDAVFNHMSGAKQGESLGTAGSVANYEKRDFPAVPYGRDDFNEACAINNYNDPSEVRNCQLNSLLDLKQSQPYVRQTIASYLNKLIEMGVAGFRIDAAKHMWPADLREIYAAMTKLNEKFGFARDARAYIYQEVIDLGGEAIKKNEYSELGDVTEFKHSVELGSIFHGHNAPKWLRNWGPEWGLLPSSDALVFVDNHDNQRGHGAGAANVLTYKHGVNYKMALIFMLAHPYGKVARLMSSYAFSDGDQGPPSNAKQEITAPRLLANGQCDTPKTGWVCEHRWRELANMVEFRNIVADSLLTNWWDNGSNQIAFERQRLGLVAINMSKSEELIVTLKTDLPTGTYRNILAQEGSMEETLVVRNDGRIEIKLPKGPSALAIHINSKV